MLIPTISEAPLGMSSKGVNKISHRQTDWNWCPAVLISKILGVSIDTPDTPLTRPLVMQEQALLVNMIHILGCWAIFL